MRNYFYSFILCAVAVTAVYPSTVLAQTEIVPDTVTIEKAVVRDVTHERSVPIPGTETLTKIQTLTVEILTGAEKGHVVTFENDYTQIHKGDTFFLRHIENSADATSFYSVADPYRLNVLLALAILFLVLLFVFGGTQGVRGLASLCGSFVLIFYALLPGILAGYSPIVVSIGVSGLIIILGSYITHGFTRTTTSAVVGMVLTVCVTGVIAYFAVSAGNLSGYTSDENVYLNFDTRGGINMVGLLFGGIMIGLLGVLYDSAIGQAVAVEELYAAGTHLSRREVYARALRIGKEHIGALVNTLAIAYVGMSLPLLLLIQHSGTISTLSLINNELFATEIVRILVGSIGLILAVPITTLVASYMLFGVTSHAKERTHHHH